MPEWHIATLKPVAQFARNPNYLSTIKGLDKKVGEWLSLTGMVAQFGAEYAVATLTFRHVGGDTEPIVWVYLPR